VDQQQAFIAAGARLRALREAKGLSQEALSLRAEVDQSTLSKVERLGPNQMSWSNILRVAEALGCVIELNFVPKK
jgi:transcriptional regulator with XRE-family HTH domain